MSHRMGKRSEKTATYVTTPEPPVWRKVIGVVLILVVVVNFFLAIFRIYDFFTFWIVLIIVAGMMWPLGFFKSQIRP